MNSATDISQKYKMGNISKGVAVGQPTLANQKIYKNKIVRCLEPESESRISTRNKIKMLKKIAALIRVEHYSLIIMNVIFYSV